MKHLLVGLLIAALTLGSTEAAVDPAPQPKMKRYRTRWHKVHGRWYKFFYLPGRKRPLPRAESGAKMEQIG